MVHVCVLSNVACTGITFFFNFHMPSSVALQIPACTILVCSWVSVLCNLVL